MAQTDSFCNAFSSYGSFWHVNETSSSEEFSGAFSSLDKVMKLKGEQITKDSLSRVILVTVGSCRYYVKLYYSGGKGLRRYLGRSRARSEWENLKYFDSLKIQTPKLVAYGEDVRFGVFRRGALITEEVANVDDLACLARQGSPRLLEKVWIRKVMVQIASYTKRLHDAGFVHKDLKWRNILVTRSDNPRVFFFDCPSGRREYGFLLERGILKDLACLDKVAKGRLPVRERLWFYKAYTGLDRIRAADRRMLGKILTFFEKRRARHRKPRRFEFKSFLRNHH